MSKTKFTPGPWQVDPKLRTGHEGGKHSYVEVAAEHSALWLARVQSFSDDKGEFAANARLIAAAPDLYEALQQIVEGYSVETVAVARAALALARGEETAHVDR